MWSPVVHFEIQAQEPARQRSFYAGLFGWEMGPEDESPMRYAMIDTAAAAGIGGGIRSAAPWPRGLTLYVRVDDLSDALARAQRLGGSTALPPTPLPRGGRFAVVRDLEGNERGLLER
jgi:predicted enzyme related to lactoylglutathione lyase